jgi:hypothetical protein
MLMRTASATLSSSGSTPVRGVLGKGEEAPPGHIRGDHAQPVAPLLVLLLGVVAQVGERADALGLEQPGHPAVQVVALEDALVLDDAHDLPPRKRDLVLPGAVLKGLEVELQQHVPKLLRVVTRRQQCRRDGAGARARHAGRQPVALLELREGAHEAYSLHASALEDQVCLEPLVRHHGEAIPPGATMQGMIADLHAVRSLPDAPDPQAHGTPYDRMARAAGRNRVREHVRGPGS